MNTYLLIMIGIICLMNLIAFIMFGVDKFKASHDLWRIPESTLILFAFLGGAIGALAGMKVFHHKTRKIKFRILIPAALVFNIAVAGFIIYKITG